MLTIRSSNRAEALLQLLLAQLRTDPPADPFAPSHIVVPSMAMRGQIQNDIARDAGICANVQFSFLAQWLWEQIAKIVEVSEESPFATEVLEWRIYALLGDREFYAPYPRLSSYLGKADPVMRYELAGRIATLFDKYTTYRPNWLEAWLRGQPVHLKNATANLLQDQQWQMALWVRIASDLGLETRHPFAAFQEKLRSLTPGALEDAGVPSRLAVFGLPAIPPLYLDMLRQLGQHIDIDIYLLNPCHQYWFDIVAPRRIRYLQLSGQEQHHEVGNRLLAMWGRQTQATISLLLDQTEPEAEIEDLLVVAPPALTLLQQTQRAILEMRDLEPGSMAQLREDRSIQVHVCHTMTRELEVLHDQLLALFNAPHPPGPSEILVVVPDLEQAAPLIDAVFGSAENTRRIAYSITGRPGSVTNPVASALLALLALVSSRYQASAVFAFLQNPLVSDRFGIAAAQLDTVQDWLQNAGVHWGLDAAHRTSFGAPLDARHTFRDGVDRLFLGYALPSAVDQPFNAMLAPCNAEGDDSLVLGLLADFIDRLRRLEHKLTQPASASQWQQHLLGILDEFFHCGPDALDDLADVRRGIVGLTTSVEAGGMNGPLEVSVIRSALQQALDEPARGGTPGGGVTFSALSSLRSLPYRVVCLLGMNDGAFPTVERALEFDLMSADPKRGDRQKREEERNLFLDLMLAARDKFYLSYCGRSVRDNAPLPPSVLVSDLLDYLAEATASSTADADAGPEHADRGHTADVASIARARAALIVEHPLQPFSDVYFDGSKSERLFSYNTQYAEALKARAAQRLMQDEAASTRAAGSGSPTRAEQSGAPLEPSPALNEVQQDASAPPDEESDDTAAANDALPRFFDAPLSAPEPEWRTVELTDLIDFFKNPSRYLLRKRMRMALPDEISTLDDDDVFLPGPLAKLALAKRLLPHLLDASPMHTSEHDDADADTARLRMLHTLAQAGLEYPSGPVGDILLKREIDTLVSFAATVRQHQRGTLLAPISGALECVIDGERWQLQGSLADLRENGLVRYRYADVKPNDYLGAWLHHLWLNHVHPSASADSRSTVWVTRNYEVALRPVDDASEHLQALLYLYRQGLQQPLHFFPKSAWSYVTKNGSDHAARSTWNGSSQIGGEREDLAFQLAFRGVGNPLDNDFIEAATIVFGGMLPNLLKDPA